MNELRYILYNSTFSVYCLLLSGLPHQCWRLEVSDRTVGIACVRVIHIRYQRVMQSRARAQLVFSHSQEYAKPILLCEHYTVPLIASRSHFLLWADATTIGTIIESKTWKNNCQDNLLTIYSWQIDFNNANEAQWGLQIYTWYKYFWMYD